MTWKRGILPKSLKCEGIELGSLSGCRPLARQYPGLCAFKLACDNMKERLPYKRPWNMMASSFFYMFLYKYRVEINMIFRFARTQLGRSLHTSASDPLSALKWLHLKQRRTYHCIIYIYKCINGVMDHSDRRLFARLRLGFSLICSRILTNIHIGFH